ncbi:GAF domain-containing protein [bacterium CPR1]|nr:GAF domain-containing protein [bacterium CPR1]
MKVTCLPEAVVDAARRTRLLDTPPEEAFDRLTRLASRMLGVPVALFTILDHDRQFFKSSFGLPEPLKTQAQTPLSHSFCQHVAIGNKPLVVKDAREHPLVKDNPAVGELGVIAYLGVPLQLKGEEPFGVLCTIDQSPRSWSDDDVQALTELAHLVVSQVELQRMARQLVELCERQSEFIGIAAHDLRNPLTVITGYSHYLQSDKANIGARERPMVDSIMESSRSMLSLVENLLDLEALKRGRLRLELEPVDLAGLLSRISHQQAPIAEAAGLTLDLAASSARVRGDRGKLEQVVNNLVSNAVKHSPAGTTIRMEVSGAPGGQVRFCVRDQGSGMDGETLGSIFQPFARLKEKRRGGAGLGLAIVESIVGAHGGHIEVESTPGQGSCFTVFLPAMA